MSSPTMAESNLDALFLLWVVFPFCCRKYRGRPSPVCYNRNAIDATLTTAESNEVS